MGTLRVWRQTPDPQIWKKKKKKKNGKGREMGESRRRRGEKWRMVKHRKK